MRAAREKYGRKTSGKELAKGLPIARYVKRFTDWSQAFNSVAELPSNGKKLLVIDEFPYMVWGNAAIPSVLQKIWDEELMTKNVMIILCGSMMSFIGKKFWPRKIHYMGAPQAF
jgi:AAA+ ATPase superfamily predicted ATPase